MTPYILAAMTLAACAWAVGAEIRARTWRKAAREANEAWHDLFWESVRSKQPRDARGRFVKAKA